MSSDEETDFIETIEEAKATLNNNPKDVMAHFKQGCAYFKFDEYETSLDVLRQGLDIARSSEIEEDRNLIPKFEMWIRKCNTNLPESKQLLFSSSAQVSTIINAPKEQPSQKEKVRHEFYQNAAQVFVTFFVKGRQDKDVDIVFHPRSIEVTIKLGDGREFQHTSSPLYGEIDPKQCSYTISANKVEVKLHKIQNIQWSSLASDDMNHISCPANVTSAPTSSKTKKDWDKMAVEIDKQFEDEKPEGDAALNKLFKDIYARADEDTRRAMMKSYVESNGTVLSTNWNEVGAKTVEATPPKGMEIRKWDV